MTIEVKASKPNTKERRPFTAVINDWKLEIAEQRKIC